MSVNQKKIANLTPHRIVILKDDGSKVEIPPLKGKDIRLNSIPQTELESYNIGGFSVPIYTAPEYDQNIEWPELEEGITAVIVSMPIGQLVQKLKESDKIPYTVLGPDTGPSSVVRSPIGEIIGVKRLIKYAEGRIPMGW